MKTVLNMITVALLAASSSAIAYDFGVNHTNQTSVKLDKWKCKRCKVEQEANSEVKDVTLKTGYANQNNDHAVNYTGLEDGAYVVVDANYTRKTEKGTEHRLGINNLGTLKSNTELSVRKPGWWEVTTAYKRTYQSDHTNGQSLMKQSGSSLMLQESLSSNELYKQREITQVKANYKGEEWKHYFTFTHQKRTGNKRSSAYTDAYEAYNFSAQIDDNIYDFELGTGKQGDNWHISTGYLGSWYDNNENKLTWLESGLEQSQDMGNESHTAFVSGQYRFNNTQVSSRLSHGIAQQDTTSANEWNHVPNGVFASDLLVYNTSANLNLNSRLSNKTRFGVKASYSKRNNESDFAAISDPELVADYDSLDISTYQLAMDASHRYSTHWKFKGGMLLKSVERSKLERKRTDNVETWFGVDWKPDDQWRVGAKLSHLVRSGSSYDEHYLYSNNNSTFMRKSYLADKNRDSVRLKLSYTPIPELAISLRTAFITDDYKHSQVGLKQVNQYRLDGDVFWSPIASLQLGLFAGYQWLDNEQLGSDSGNSATWRAETDEEFGYTGTNLTYSGFADQGILLDADYLLSYSESWTRTSHSGYLGDYRSYAHQFKLRGRYQLNSQTTFGLSYQYVNHFDNDDANIASDTGVGQGVFNLETLGEVNNDYDAHLIMATLNYRF